MIVYPLTACERRVVEIAEIASWSVLAFSLVLALAAYVV
jgi:hypothetical protein